MRARALLAVLLAAAIGAGAAGAKRPEPGAKKLPRHAAFLVLNNAVEGRFRLAEIPDDRKAPIVLHRGRATDAVLKWARAALVDKQPVRIDGAIVVFDRKRGTVTRWTFAKGYPVKWSVPDIDAPKAKVSIESIEIAHEGITRS